MTMNPSFHLGTDYQTSGVNFNRKNANTNELHLFIHKTITMFFLIHPTNQKLEKRRTIALLQSPLKSNTLLKNCRYLQILVSFFPHLVKCSDLVLATETTGEINAISFWPKTESGRAPCESGQHQREALIA